MYNRTMPRCSRCKEEKSATEFWGDGKRIHRYCKPCSKEVTAAWRQRNPDRYRYLMARWRQRHRGYDYDLSNDALKDLIKAQGGVCAICRVYPLALEDKNTHIDHDHVTNAVRGVLCRRCNYILGLADDDPSRLLRAIEYLKVGDAV